MKKEDELFNSGTTVSSNLDFTGDPQDWGDTTTSPLLTGTVTYPYYGYWGCYSTEDTYKVLNFRGRTIIYCFKDGGVKYAIVKSNGEITFKFTSSLEEVLRLF